MNQTVAIVAPGQMGSGVGARLSENGLKVTTTLVGRSQASVARAAAADMQAVAERQLAEADFLLSIVPPGDALALAQQLAPILTAANKKPVYVECNAINPRHVIQIESVIAATGCPFVGASIIGPPPKPDRKGPTFYACGPAAARFATLGAHGLTIHVLDGPVTAASALKMSYAGITKGLTALGATMMLAASRGGAAEALRRELAQSQPALLEWLTRQVPNMYAKAYRWVAEMDEISQFVGDDRAEHGMLEAGARFYQRLAADFAAAQRETGELSRLLRREEK